MSDRHRHPLYGPKGRKGVYAKARRCEIIGFTGIDNPYEAPENPEITLETVIAKPEQNARRVLEHLEHQGFVRWTPIGAIRTAARPLLFSVGLAVVVYLIWDFGPATIWETFRRLSWGVLIVLVFPASIVVVLDTVGWRFTFARPPRSLFHLLGVRLAGEAINTSTPTASVGGEPIKAYLLRPEIATRDALMSVIADKTTVVVSQVILLAVGLLAGFATLPFSHPLMLTMAGLLAVEVICAAGFVIIQLGGAVGGGGRLLSRLGIAPGITQVKLEGFDHALRAVYVERWCPLLASTLYHFLASAIETLEIYLIVRFLGVPMPATVALGIGAFGNAVRFLSFMIPASLGAVETANVALFAAFGLAGSVGLTCTLVQRLREILWTAAGFAALSRLSARPASRQG